MPASVCVCVCLFLAVEVLLLLLLLLQQTMLVLVLVGTFQTSVFSLQSLYLTVLRRGRADGFAMEALLQLGTVKATQVCFCQQPATATCNQHIFARPQSKL